MEKRKKEQSGGIQDRKYFVRLGTRRISSRDFFALRRDYGKAKHSMFEFFNLCFRHEN